MSVFYKSLSYWDNMKFKKRKRDFKRGKPCAVCGRKFSKDKMMVAHIIPVRELPEYDALYDTTNWEVRCIYCEHRLNREEALKNKRMVQRAKEIPSPSPYTVATYEVDIYVDYERTVQGIWDRAKAHLKMGKKHRKSTYLRLIENEVKKADRITLAKATARFVLRGNKGMPTLQDIYDMLEKDVETKMMFETNGKFKAEKGGGK